MMSAVCTWHQPRLYFAVKNFCLHRDTQLLQNTVVLAFSKTEPCSSCPTDSWSRWAVSSSPVALLLLFSVPLTFPAFPCHESLFLSGRLHTDPGISKWCLLYSWGSLCLCDRQDGLLKLLKANICMIKVLVHPMLHFWICKRFQLTSNAFQSSHAAGPSWDENHNKFYN